MKRNAPSQSRFLHHFGGDDTPGQRPPDGAPGDMAAQDRSGSHQRTRAATSLDIGAIQLTSSSPQPGWAFELDGVTQVSSSGQLRRFAPVAGPDGGLKRLAGPEPCRGAQRGVRSLEGLLGAWLGQEQVDRDGQDDSDDESGSGEPLGVSDAAMESSFAGLHRDRKFT